MTIAELERQMRVCTFYNVKDSLPRSVCRRIEQAIRRGQCQRDSLSSPGDILARQKFIRRSFLESIGGLPSRGPLTAVKTGEVVEPGLRIEKLVLCSDKVTIPAVFYLPENGSHPMPGVLFLSGHSDQGKQWEPYQRVCRILARAGLAVLAPDPPGQGERFEYWESGMNGKTVTGCTTEHVYAGQQCLAVGDSPARYFLSDAMCAVDYLISRPEVDPQRIGVTGNSGGGTQASMVMLADERIAAAAIGTFLSSQEEIFYSGKPQDTEQVWPGLLNLGMEHEDILLSFAPKPALVLAVSSDFFPMEGTVPTVERARRYWEILGNPGWPVLETDLGEHCYTPYLAEKAAAFFSREWDCHPCSMISLETLPSESLWCTPKGQVLDAYPQSDTLYTRNLRRMGRHELQADAVSWLKKQVFRDRISCKPYPRLFERTQVQDITCFRCVWRSEGSRMSAGVLFCPARGDKDGVPITVAVWAGGTGSLSAHFPWIRSQCGRGSSVFVVDLACDGMLSPNPLCGEPPDSLFGTCYFWDSYLMHLGDSLASVRIWDTLQAVECARQLPGIPTGPISFYGSGDFGVYPLLAALAADVKYPVELDGCPFHQEVFVKEKYPQRIGIPGLLLPGMLRHFTMEDCRKWLGSQLIRTTGTNEERE